MAMTIEEIAAMPWRRPGETNFDCARAVIIWDAKQRVALKAMIAVEPDKPHDSPDGLMHYIPHKRTDD